MFFLAMDSSFLFICEDRGLVMECISEDSLGVCSWSSWGTAREGSLYFKVQKYLLSNNSRYFYQARCASSLQCHISNLQSSSSKKGYGNALGITHTYPFLAPSSKGSAHIRSKCYGNWGTEAGIPQHSLEMLHVQFIFRDKEVLCAYSNQ